MNWEKLIGPIVSWGLLFSFSTLPGCGGKIPAEKQCGQPMTPAEIEAVQQRDTAYDYSDDDWNLHSDVAQGVMGLYKDTLEIEVFFFLHDQSGMGILIGLPDKAVGTGKIACYLLNTDFNGRMPRNRYILFFQSENSDWMAGIKTKGAP